MTDPPDPTSTVGIVLRIINSEGVPDNRTWPFGMRIPVRGDWMRIQGMYVEVQSVIWETPGGPADPAATIGLSDPFRA